MPFRGAGGPCRHTLDPRISRKPAYDLPLFGLQDQDVHVLAQRILRPGEPETDRVIKRLQRVGDVAGTGSRFEALALPGAEKGHDRRFPGGEPARGLYP